MKSIAETAIQRHRASKTPNHVLKSCTHASLEYRPEIDGLRAIAVVAVVLFHAEFVIGDINLLSGGFIGVDVFFVISGYLITSIILRDIAQHQFSFLSFYERRARRILPSLFIVLAASAPLAWIYMLPREVKEYAGSALSALTFGSNIWFWKDIDYWAAPIDQKPLLHTWSLSVEEQFYIIFPLLILLVYALFRSYLAIIFLLLLLVSLSAAHFASSDHPEAAFYLLPMRGWELLAGAILAKMELKAGRISCPPLSLAMPAIGLTLIVLSFALFSEKTRHPSLITILPVAGTMLLIWFARPGECVSNILSSRPFVGIGLVSYSFYLWHYPLFAFAQLRNGESPQYAKFGLIIAALFLSVLTYFFVEKPFRNKSRLDLKSLSIVMAISASSLLVFFSLAFATNGFEDIFKKRFPLYSVYESLQEDETQIDNGDCHFYAWSLSNAWAIKRFRKCANRYGGGIVILGDSHSRDLYNAISLNTSRKFVFQLSGRNCSHPEAARPACGYAGFEEFVKANRQNIDLIIYEEAGHKLFKDPRTAQSGRELFRKSEIPEYALRENFMRMTHNYLNVLADYTQVVWFGPRIEPHISILAMLKRECEDKILLPHGLEDNFKKLDNFLKEPSLGKKKYAYRSQIDAIEFDFTEIYFLVKRFTGMTAITSREAGSIDLAKEL